MFNLSGKLTNDDRGFREFCEYLQKVSGITIGEKKSYLVTTRIGTVLNEYGLENLEALVRALRLGDKALHQCVINSMTVNETLWFRDTYPFDCFFNTLLPRWNADPCFERRPVRIWCAACSSGQEPYSLAMLVEEYREAHRFVGKLEIVATDLSSDVLDKAILGEYDHLSIGRGLSKNRLNKHFLSNGHNKWTIKPNVRQHVEFKSINLLDSFTNLGKFDMIFCRNVLIYFTKDVKTDILYRMHSILHKQGVLCLGASETLGDASSYFQSLNCNPGLLFQAKASDC